MLKILVTGVNGFVGKHLVRELVGSGHKVYGLGLGKVHPEISDLLTRYWPCDLTSVGDVKKLPLEKIEGIINLAGLAKVGPSFDQPELYKKVNVDVLSVVGNRIIDEKLSIRILAISTGAVYEAKQKLPLTEESELITSGSPYAQSKILMEQEAKNLIAKGLDCVIARPFNHIGPGQESGFLVPDLYQKIGLALSKNESLKIGDLSTKRDYTDVRDVVRAYSGLIAAPKLSQDTYNVCSGRSLPGEQILQLLLEAMNVSSKIHVEVDPSLIRPNDPADLYGSNKPLNTDTGWSPKINIEQTIKDFVSAMQSSGLR